MELKNTPLYEQIGQLEDFLQHNGYSQKTIRNYAQCWGKLESYAVKKGCESFTVELGNSFLLDMYGVNDVERPVQKLKDQARAIKLLRDFMLTGNIAPYQKRCPAIPKQFTDINSHYMDFLCNSGQQYKSLKTKQSRLRQFLVYLSNEKTETIESLTKSDLLRFMSYLKDKYSSAGRGNILYTVKDFLLFCASENIINDSIPTIIKGIHINPNEKLPSVYSFDEIKTILGGMNRETSEGKKDYAILLLASVLGLRASDIINIKLDDIKWSQSVIEFYQKKTGQFTQLPLTDNVKFALLDYVNNSRPASKYENLFIRARAPIAPYKDTATIFSIVSKYITLSGIPIGNRNHGPHVFRHSIASGMLENKISLPTIAAALGHNNTKNTGRYIRIDIELLRSMALEVPK